MSQATQPAPPSAAPKVNIPVSVAAGPPRARAEAAAQDPGAVPAMLTRLRLAATLVCLLAAALTALQLLTSWQATRAAAAQTEQLVRVQSIKVNLLRADALATNAFLVGGLEPATQRAAYDAAVAQVTHDIADAAEAQPADRAVLSALNEAVLGYGTSMELARANNRQGFPVGAAYLSQASGTLRATTLPLVDALVTANQARAQDSMGSPRAWLVVVPGILGIAALVLVNNWIATRFRRRVNVGLAVGAAALLVATLGAGWVTASQGSENAALSRGDFRSVVRGADARSAANDAKANESLRLINRGNGAANEAKWVAAAKTVTADTSGTAATQWQAYAAKHQAIVTLDTAGSWDDAVSAATSTAADSSSAAFDAVDRTLRQGVDQSGARATDALRGGVVLFVVMAALAALAGLVAAGTSWAGISRRLEEYA